MKQDRKKRAPEGRIVSFYSYKGGTGRSMAVANIAWILALSGKKVLVVDWDLEAPGIHRYFHPFLEDKELVRTEGLIDFIEKLAGRAAVASSPLSADQVDVIEYVTMLKWPANFSVSWERFGESAGIDLLVAGRQGPAYGPKLNSFNWIDFYEKLGGRRLLEIVRQQLREIYDYVLIDSRTGVSDTSGICTVEMPDTLVTCFTLNDQSILGASGVMTSVQALRQSHAEPIPTDANAPLDVKSVSAISTFRIFPVPTRVEIVGEHRKRQVALELAQQKFSLFVDHLPRALRSRYWGRVQLAYFPFYAFEEIPAVFGDPANEELSISTPLKHITRYITDNELLEVVPLAPDDELEAEALRKEVLGWYLRKGDFSGSDLAGKKPPRVFISYSHDSSEHKDRVLAFADRLREDGVDATLDQYEVSPEGGWPLWMERQIEMSDFVLVVCTKAYARRLEQRSHDEGRGVTWQSTLLYQNIYGDNTTKFIPVLLEEAEADSIPLPLQAFTYYQCNEDRGYLDLYRRLTNQPFITMPGLGKIENLPRRERSSQTAAQSKLTRCWNVPYPRNDAFTGREQLLTDLRIDLLKKGKEALFGLGGVGKTQIAVEYAYRHRDEYTAVLWCFAGTEQSVRSGYASIAALLNLPEKESQEQARVTDAVRNWLEQNTGWLLVLDNADDPAMLKPFLPQQGKGHILLTSRAYSFQKIGLVSPREVNVLSPNEAREFLERRAGKEPTDKSPEADALAKEVGYLPLALEQAAAYIAETGTGFSNYLTGYRKQRLKLLERHGPVMGNDEKEQQKRTVATTWALNFADIEKSSPASADLLRLSAFLASDAVPFELFEKGGEQMPDELAAKLAGLHENPLILDELLNPLLRYSLIRRDYQEHIYSINPLVQEVLRDGLSNDDRKAWAQIAVKAVNLAFPYPEFENWSFCRRLLPQALQCATHIDFFQLRFIEAALLLNKAGNYLLRRADYAQAERLLRRALELYEFNLGTEHPDTARSLDNLAELYRLQGRYAEAEPLQRHALAIRERVQGSERPDTAHSLNNLALLLSNEGKDADAEPLYRRALAIREKVLGAEHPDTAQSLNNLALLLSHQGNYADAELLHRRALAVREKALGPEHPDTAWSLNNLARLLSSERKYAEAEPLNRRALAIYEKTLGPEHPDTAWSLNNLAALLSNEGHYADAEPLFQRALAIHQRALGSEHPATLFSRNNLIRFYRQQGRNTEADALEKSAKTGET